MTSAAIARQRLASQQIARPAFATPGEVVAHLGAMQAQDYPGALWSVGLRLPEAAGATEADVERALAERSIVRTWPMRGTLHFVAAADVRWMVELLAPRVLERAAARRAQLELDKATLAAAARTFEAALAGGRQLTRQAMCDLLNAHGISPAGQRGYHVLAHLAQTGLLCFGAAEGKQQTFALLEEWVPGAARLPRDEALAALAQRYFAGHGPATVHDFVWWSGLTVTEARAGLAAAAGELLCEKVGGREYWAGQAQPAAAATSAPDMHLLPGFDEYLLGYTDRSAALDPAHAARVHPGGNGVFRATLVSGGQVVGLWRRTPKAKAVTVALEPFAALGEAEQRAAVRAAERYGRYLSKAAQVTVEPAMDLTGEKP